MSNESKSTKVTKVTTSENLIIAKTPWTSYVEMPIGSTQAVRDFKEDMEIDGAGVYQVALKKDAATINDDVYIDENIGYIGKGKDVFKRVYGIKTGRHACGKMLGQMNIKLEDVMIRFLFTEQGKESTLENDLHKQMHRKFKYRFKWKKASGGHAGLATQAMDIVEKMDNPAELVDIINKARDKFTVLMLDAALQYDMKGVVDEYFGD